jgi:hypothetical protein
MDQRVNLPLSLSTKAAMRINKFATDHDHGFPAETTHTQSSKTTLTDIKKKKYYCDMENELSERLVGVKVESCKTIQHKNTTYKLDQYILNNYNNPTECLKIVDFLFFDHEHWIVTEIYTIALYNDHLRSFEIGESTETFKMFLVKDIKGLPFNLHKTVLGKEYFRIKHI